MCEGVRRASTRHTSSFFAEDLHFTTPNPCRHKSCTCMHSRSEQWNPTFTRSTMLSSSSSRLDTIHPRQPCLSHLAPLADTMSTSFSTYLRSLSAAIAPICLSRLRTSSHIHQLLCISCASLSARHQCPRFLGQGSSFPATFLERPECCDSGRGQPVPRVSLPRRSRVRRYEHLSREDHVRTQRLARLRQHPCLRHPDSGCIECASSSQGHRWYPHSSGLFHRVRKARPHLCSCMVYAQKRVR